MDAILIKGGTPLIGEVRVSGAKNAALPMLAASLLVGGKFRYENVPDLKDIESILELMSVMGAEVHRQGKTVEVDTSDLDNFEAPYEHVRKMRASVLVLGPLLARLKRARVSLPGGCAIGARPINMHLEGLTN
ncbi:MAG: UDP-N-acetylglucosamine 1-carboxyvinyltransferase, partial [Desulfosalsimonas sp.]